MCLAGIAFVRPSFWPCQSCCCKHHFSRAPKTTCLREKCGTHSPRESYYCFGCCFSFCRKIQPPRSSIWLYRSVKPKQNELPRCYKPALEAVSFACVASRECSACACVWQSWDSDRFLLRADSQDVGIFLCPPKNPACPGEPVCKGRCASVGNTLSQEPQHIYHLETACGDLINAGRFYFVSEHLRAYPPFGITSTL